MTDPEFADATYVEPITPEFVAKVIAGRAPGRDPHGHPGRARPRWNTAVALHELGRAAAATTWS